MTNLTTNTKFIMKPSKIAIFICIGLLLSCGSKKKISKTQPSTSPITETIIQQEVKPVSIPENQKIQIDNKSKPKNINSTTSVHSYIEQYASIAMDKMREYNIPASITMAQGILESSYGNSDLTRSSNNHFGIKCHKGWTGKRVYYDDDEQGECFRKYKKAEDSYRDHSLFLSQRKRYATLFHLKKDDYKGWAHGLQKAGYATDKRYAKKLINLIERYKLYQLDSNVLDNLPKSISRFYKVKKGDTLYTIAKRFKTDVQTLKSINKLTSNIIEVGQRLKVN